jgi:hypothetical protein
MKIFESSVQLRYSFPMKSSKFSFQLYFLSLKSFQIRIFLLTHIVEEYVGKVDEECKNDQMYSFISR